MGVIQALRKCLCLTARRMADFLFLGIRDFWLMGYLGEENHSSGDLVDKVPVQTVKRL